MTFKRFKNMGKKEKFKSMTRSFDFAKVLYVQERMHDEDDQTARTSCDEAEDGDVIGVYRLEKICRIKHETKVLLEDM
jgi:hypothetical protein